MSAPPSFTKEDFALWNQTTSVFYLPKRLVGKSKVPQLRAELVKTIGEKKVSAVQALPDFKFRVCFSSPSVRCAYDINGLNFRGLTITPFPAYEEVKAVFVDRSPLQMPDQFLYDTLAPYGRVISVKHLTIRGFPTVKSGTRMVSMIVSKAIPAEIRVAGFPLSFRYRGQPPTCFVCQEVGHTAKDCPKSRKRQGRNPSKAKDNSLKEPAPSGSKKSGSSSSHLRDLRVKLNTLKQTFVPPVVSGEDSPPQSQPKSPLVEVVEVVPVASSSSPSAHHSAAGLGLQQDSFEFSLEAPRVDPVAPSSSGLCQPFARSVRRKGKVSLEIVVPSTASRVGPANNQHTMKNHNNRNNDTSNVPAATRKSGVPNHNNHNNAATSPVIARKSGINNNNKAASPTRKSGRQSNKLARSGVKSSSSVDRGVGVKSSHDSFSSSSSASEDDTAPAETSCRHKSKRLRNSTVISVPPSSPPVSVAQVLPSPVDSVVSAEAMEEEVDVDACLTGASVIDPVAPEEFLPVAAAVAPSAAPAVVVNVSASPRSVVEDDNAASQDCPSWPISSPQSEPGTYLANSQSLFQDGSLGSLFDDPGDVSASSTCTSSGDQVGADRLQELLNELHAESTDSDVEPALPQH
jgi:hypothetical protein